MDPSWGEKHCVGLCSYVELGVVDDAKVKCNMKPNGRAES